MTTDSKKNGLTAASLALDPDTLRYCAWKAEYDSHSHVLDDYGVRALKSLDSSFRMMATNIERHGESKEARKARRFNVVLDNIPGAPIAPKGKNLTLGLAQKCLDDLMRHGFDCRLEEVP